MVVIFLIIMFKIILGVVLVILIVLLNKFLVILFVKCVVLFGIVLSFCWMIGVNICLKKVLEIR